MNRSTNHTRQVIATTLWITILLGISSISWAEDLNEAERLYADNCAVCHGADQNYRPGKWSSWLHLSQSARNNPCPGD